MRNFSSLWLFYLCFIIFAWNLFMKSAGTPCKNNRTRVRMHRHLFFKSDENLELRGVIRCKRKELCAKIRNQQAVNRKFLAKKVAAMGKHFRTFTFCICKTPFRCTTFSNPCCTACTPRLISKKTKPCKITKSTFNPNRCKCRKKPFASPFWAPLCYITTSVKERFTPCRCKDKTSTRCPSTSTCATTTTVRATSRTPTTPRKTSPTKPHKPGKCSITIECVSSTKGMPSKPEKCTCTRTSPTKSAVVVSKNFTSKWTESSTKCTRGTLAMVDICNICMGGTLKCCGHTGYTTLSSNCTAGASMWGVLKCCGHTGGATSSTKCTAEVSKCECASTPSTKCTAIVAKGSGCTCEPTPSAKCTAEVSRCSRCTCDSTPSAKCTAGVSKCCGWTCEATPYLKCTAGVSKCCGWTCEATPSMKCTADVSKCCGCTCEATPFVKCTAGVSKCCGCTCEATSSTRCTADVSKYSGQTWDISSNKLTAGKAAGNIKSFSCKCGRTFSCNCTADVPKCSGCTYQATPSTRCTAEVSKYSGQTWDMSSTSCTAGNIKSFTCKCGRTFSCNCTAAKILKSVRGCVGSFSSSTRFCNLNCECQRHVKSEQLPYLPLYEENSTKKIENEFSVSRVVLVSTRKSNQISRKGHNGKHCNGKRKEEIMVTCKFNRKCKTRSRAKFNNRYPPNYYSISEPKKSLGKILPVSTTKYGVWMEETTCRHIVLKYETTCQLFYRDKKEKVDENLGLISVLEYFPPNKSFGNFAYL